jgi:protein CrcB
MSRWVDFTEEDEKKFISYSKDPKIYEKISNSIASAIYGSEEIKKAIACLLFGFIIGLADHKQILSPPARLFLATGFCGGFSTFSTFSGETLTLFQQGHYMTTALYVFGSVLICVAATFGGLFIAGKI